MLLFANDLLDPSGLIVGNGLRRVLEESVQGACLTRRHGRRQVDQPLRVDGPTAHHLQRGNGILLPDRDVGTQPRLYDALAGHIGQIENIVVFLLGGHPRVLAARLRRHRRQGADRLAVDLGGRDGDQLVLRVAQGGQLTPEDTARVDVNGAVEPFGFRHWSVAIDHLGPTPVFGGPVVAHRQAKFVDFTRGFSIEAEGTHRTGTPALHLFLQAGVGHYQLTVVKDIMADQAAEEQLQGFNKFL